MRISASVGRISRLKRFLSMPKNRGASRKQMKRGGVWSALTTRKDCCVVGLTYGTATGLASVMCGLQWTLAEISVREQ